MGRHAPGRCLEKRIAFRDGQIWGGTARAWADGSWWLTDGDIYEWFGLVLFPLFRKSKFIVIKCPFMAYPYRKLQYDIAGWYIFVHVFGSMQLILDLVMPKFTVRRTLSKTSRRCCCLHWEVSKDFSLFGCGGFSMVEPFFFAFRTGSLSGRRMCHT